MTRAHFNFVLKGTFKQPPQPKEAPPSCWDAQFQSEINPVMDLLLGKGQKIIFYNNNDDLIKINGAKQALELILAAIRAARSWKCSPKM